MAVALQNELFDSKGKVLPFGNYEVMEVFKAFLSMHKKNSVKTMEDYQARVEEFFKMTLKKPIKFVTIEELHTIKAKDVQTKYIDELEKRGNCFNTIQTKLNSVRSFYNELLKNEIMVNPIIFKVKLPVEVNHHEALSRDELQLLFDHMKSEKELATEKYLLVKMMFTTANRRTATMGMKTESGMTWEDNFVIRKDKVTGQEIHVVRVQDKGKKWIEKPISDEFYQELQQINKGQEYVFNMSSKTLARALERFSKKIDKKITPHSLKATAITIGYQMTKDIELCRQLGGHSSMVTTEIYIREEKSLVNQLSYNMSREVDDSVLESLSHRELLDFINSNEDIKMAILLRLGK
jgi:site-specific recombinase XerC